MPSPNPCQCVKGSRAMQPDLPPHAERATRLLLPPEGLEGHLALPPDPSGVVLFAHASASSRRSPRNVEMAASLRKAGFGTLLFDLLTEAEARDRRNAFDIALLAGRLAAAADSVAARPCCAGLPVGLFGAGTGAAAALIAASMRPGLVRAVVARGGRPDLAAADILARVTAPTLLIVGAEDASVLRLNLAAASSMTCPVELAPVPGAAHHFEEPGALEAVARRAEDWFAAHLAAPMAVGVLSPARSDRATRPAAP